MLLVGEGSELVFSLVLFPPRRPSHLCSFLSKPPKTSLFPRSLCPLPARGGRSHQRVALARVKATSCSVLPALCQHPGWAGTPTSIPTSPKDAREDAGPAPATSIPLVAPHRGLRTSSPSASPSLLALFPLFLPEQQIKSFLPADKLERKEGKKNTRTKQNPPQPDNEYLGGKRITGALKIKERLLNENVEAERH